MASVVFMGVSGCGKSSLARAVSAASGLPFVEGDDFHSQASQAKMRQGMALTDADRQGWLEALAAQLRARPQGVLLTCSALKRAYRQVLRAASPGLRFVFLDLDLPTAHARVASRAGHVFPAGLVASQFLALERPDGELGVLQLDAVQPVAALCAQVVRWMDAPAAQVP
jgi:gluconokinase